MTKKSDLNNFLEGAKASKENAMTLRNTSNTLFRYEPARQLAIFFLLTAIEEIQKAIFCLFVHKGWMPKKAIDPVFRDHKTKVILFDEIFHGNFSIQSNTAILNDKPLSEIDFKELIKKHEDRWKKHKAIRESCLYVGKNESWSKPQEFIKNPLRLKNELMVELTSLATVYERIIGDTENITQIDNFKLDTKYRKDELENFSIEFDEI